MIVALAPLFLDTDTSEFEDAIVQQCNAAGVGRERVEELLFDVVAPILRSNLGSVAGEWSGFDEAWLLERAARTSRRPWLWRLRQRRIRRALEPQWSRIRERIRP